MKTFFLKSLFLKQKLILISEVVVTSAYLRIFGLLPRLILCWKSGCGMKKVEKQWFKPTFKDPCKNFSILRKNL